MQTAILGRFVVERLKRFAAARESSAANQNPLWRRPSQGYFCHPLDMNPRTLGFSLLILTAVGALAQPATEIPSTPPGPASTDGTGGAQDYSIVERGAYYRIWSKVRWETNALGGVMARTNSYTELASGMYYLDGGQWLESMELIESVPGGAVARHGQTQVLFANNLATAGAVDLQTSDGKHLTSHVTGLSYFDSASGTNILIASVKDCQGKILPPNQVIYEDAFDGFKASVRYTYTRGSFEQDIILLESPALPEAYGLDPATTRLVVMTEFLNPPQPAVQESVIKDPAGAPLQDDTLDFGALHIGPGTGVLLGTNASGAELRIFKQWAEMKGRQF